MKPDQIKVTKFNNQLSNKTCEKFRKLPLSFNDMVRSIFNIAIKYSGTGPYHVDNEEVQKLIECEETLIKISKENNENRTT